MGNISPIYKISTHGPGWARSTLTPFTSDFKTIPLGFYHQLAILVLDANDMKAVRINRINQLPVELLVEILLLVLTSSSQDTEDRNLQHRRLHRLSLVCRHWRKSINGHGAFWTSIFFSPWKGDEYIQELVTRSRSQQLSVFLTFDYNAYPDNCENPRLYRARMRRIITTFHNLLQTEGHRIKLLHLMNDRPQKLSRATLGKTFPVLKTFIFDENDLFTDGSDSFSIIKATKALENLNMNLQRTSVSTSSLSELKPSLEHLRTLKFRCLSDELKEQIFISLLPFCYKLESLIIAEPLNYRFVIPSKHLPPTITLTSLVSLDVDCYALVHRLRAPALRRLNIELSYLWPLDQHGYLIFDEYDLSSITQFVVIKAFDILRRPLDSSLVVEGLTDGSQPRDEDPWASFEMNRDTNYDLEKHSISFSGPTQFCLELPTYHTPINGEAPFDFRPSLALSKILSKLHNLERLYITPYSISESFEYSFRSGLEFLRRFLNIFFDNLISSNIKQLGIMEVGRSIPILQLIFDLVNNCFALSNLDTMELGNRDTGLWHSNYESVHEFAEELVICLESRQKAGHRTLSRLGVELGSPLPEKCIADAAILGTRIVPCEEWSR